MYTHISRKDDRKDVELALGCVLGVNKEDFELGW